jgi:hypothetical protein
MRSHHLVEGALIPDLHCPFDGGVLDDEEAPVLRIRAIGRVLPRCEDAIGERIGYGVGLEAPHCPRRLHDLEKLAAGSHEISSRCASVS